VKTQRYNRPFAGQTGQDYNLGIANDRNVTRLVFLPDQESRNPTYEFQPNNWEREESKKVSIKQRQKVRRKKVGRGPPEGRFLYFPKLFPVRWLYWKVEALPALGVISAVHAKNLRILRKVLY